MNNMLLTEPHFEFLSLKGGPTKSPESTHVKIPHCWKSHVTAQICLVADAVYFSSLYRSSHSLDMKTGSELLILLLMVSNVMYLPRKHKLIIEPRHVISNNVAF